MNPSPYSPEAVLLCDEGYALLESGDIDKAAVALLRAAALAPTYPLVHYRLGLLYSDTGRPADALKVLATVIGLQPDNARAHNNQGSALQLLGRNKEAESAYRRAISLAPELDLPYINLGKLLEMQGKVAQAIDVYRSALADGRDASVLGHYLAAASGAVATRAPANYVRETFDNFAPLFDAQLRSLHYRVPEQLAAMVGAHAHAPLDIVDLGCGTGQCGTALQSIKQVLVGVDLSEKMLVQARQLGIYDELIAREVMMWLAEANDASFDLAIAADVFIYLGDLGEVFRYIARVLRPGGWFAFSTEECNDADYALLGSGRFAQSESYIRRLAQASFRVVQAEPTVIRMESGVPLIGRLYLCQKRL